MIDLAINGGAPAVPVELASRQPKWPYVTEEDKRAVMEVLEGRDFWAMNNPIVEGFESDFARYCGVDHGLALDSGTAALHAAVAAAGVGPGDEVITTAFSFLASATGVLHHNAIPVFVDIDPHTFNIDPAKIEERITPRTKAIIPVHFHGLPADMDEINALAKRRGLVVIEDASQAQGALYKGRKTGGLGDMGAFSIMWGKGLPSAGEGGILVTSNPDYRAAADMIRLFGEVIEKGKKRAYDAYSLGWNYRANVTNVAFAHSQLKRLDEYNRLRQEKMSYFMDRIRDIPGIILPRIPSDRTMVYYALRLRLDPRPLGLDMPAGLFRATVQEMLEAENCPVSEYQNVPIPGQQLFQRKEGYGKGCPWSCPHSGRVEYRIEDYPVTLQVIEDSFVMKEVFCLPHNEQAYLDAVIAGFHKVFECKDHIARQAAALGKYVPVWKTQARLV